LRAAHPFFPVITKICHRCKALRNPILFFLGLNFSISEEGEDLMAAFPAEFLFSQGLF
jgi:hypothetical protein